MAHSSKYQGSKYNEAERRIRKAIITGRKLLDLNSLGLTELPDNLGKLKNLQWLNLENNQISALPESIGNLKNLQELYLDNNQLNVLPESIGKLTKLHSLALDHNQLSALPESIGNLKNLQELYLDNNQLRALPESIVKLTKLHTSYLHGNPKLKLPESLLHSVDAQQILRYYVETQGEKGEPLLELKLLLVGRGKAGKTTLVKRLAGEEADANEPEIHSISIREIILNCPRGQVRTRAWDFGGQEILHSTHQFFLTERSLYLLVLEPRSGLAQRDAEYWLKLIETQGGASPVIVAMNCSHGRQWQVDKVKLRRKFQFIVDFLPTDAFHGDGIKELWKAIVNAVEERMPEVWHPFPKRWHKVKDRVGGYAV